MTVIVAHFLSRPVAGRYLVGPTKSRGIDTMRHFLRLMFFGGLAVLVSSSARGGEYVQTNIVSDLAGVAPNVRPESGESLGSVFQFHQPLLGVEPGKRHRHALQSSGVSGQTRSDSHHPDGRNWPPHRPHRPSLQLPPRDFLIPAHGSPLTSCLPLWTARSRVEPGHAGARCRTLVTVRCCLHRAGPGELRGGELPVRRQRRRKHHGLRHDLQQRDGDDLRRQVC